MVLMEIDCNTRFSKEFFFFFSFSSSSTAGGGEGVHLGSRDRHTEERE